VSVVLERLGMRGVVDERGSRLRGGCAGTRRARGATGRSTRARATLDELRMHGAISPQLCGGSTLDTIHQTIRNSSDILPCGDSTFSPANRGRCRRATV
jgi:hypothetical protein